MQKAVCDKEKFHSERTVIFLVVSSSHVVVNVNIFETLLLVSRASQFNQPKLISLLVENGAKVNIHDGEGQSPFLNAVAAGYIDSARVLIKAGADVNATDLLMKTCVHIAVENEQLKILAMLLECRHGTRNLYKADLWDRVPLHYAAKSKDIKVKGNTSEIH